MGMQDSIDQAVVKVAGAKVLGEQRDIAEKQLEATSALEKVSTTEEIQGLQKNLKTESTLKKEAKKAGAGYDPYKAKLDDEGNYVPQASLFDPKRGTLSRYLKERDTAMQNLNDQISAKELQRNVAQQNIDTIKNRRFRREHPLQAMKNDVTNLFKKETK